MDSRCYPFSNTSLYSVKNKISVVLPRDDTKSTEVSTRMHARLLRQGVELSLDLRGARVVLGHHRRSQVPRAGRPTCPAPLNYRERIRNPKEYQQECPSLVFQNCVSTEIPGMTILFGHSTLSLMISCLHPVEFVRIDM